MFRSILSFAAAVQCAEFFNDPADANEDLFSDILPPIDQMVEGSGWGSGPFIKTADADLPTLKTRPCVMKPGDVAARVTPFDVFPGHGLNGVTTTGTTTTNTATTTTGASFAPEFPTAFYGLNATNSTGLFVVDGKYMGGGKYKKNKVCLILDRASQPGYRYVDISENMFNVTRHCPHKWAGSCNCSAQVAATMSAIHGRVPSLSHVCNDPMTIGNPLFKHGLKNPWRYAHALNDLVTATGTIKTGYNPLYFKNYPMVLFDDQGEKAACKRMSYIPKLAEFIGNAPSWVWISDFTPGSIMRKNGVIAVPLPVQAPLPGRPLNKWSKSGVIVIRQHPQDSGSVDIWVKFAWLRSIHKGNNTLGIPKTTGECHTGIRYACSITIWKPEYITPSGSEAALTCDNFYDNIDPTNPGSAIVPTYYLGARGPVATAVNAYPNLQTQAGSYQNMAYFENIYFGVEFYEFSEFLVVVHDNFGRPVWCNYLSQCKINKKKLKQKGIYKSCYK